MTREEKEAELVRLEKENELAELEHENARLESVHDEDIGPLQYAARSAKGIPQIVSDYVPFVEPIRKAGYATQAAVRSGFDSEEYDRLFREIAAKDQAEMERTRQETPAIPKALAHGLGFTATLGMGGPSGPAGRGALAVGQRILGASALGGAEAALSNPNPDKLIDLERGGEGALFSGVAQLGGESLLKALSPENRRRIYEMARERGVKAITGQNLAWWRKMSGTGAATEDMSALEKAGDFLLTKDASGKIPLDRRGRPETMLPKLETYSSEESRPALRQVAELIDAQYPQGIVSGKVIAKDIRDYARKLPETGNTENVISNLEREARRYDPGAPDVPMPTVKTGSQQYPLETALTGAKQLHPKDVDLLVGQPGRSRDLPLSKYLEPPPNSMRGSNIDALMAGRDPYERRLTFGQLRHQKQGYPFKWKDPNTHSFGQEGSNELNSIMRRQENAAAQRVADDINAPQEVRDAASNFQKLKSEEQSARALIEAAEKRTNANSSNRYYSPSDQYWASEALRAMGYGTAAGVGSYIAGDSPLAAGAAALGVMGLHKYGRTRGAAFTARALNDLSKMRQPDVFLGARSGMGAYKAFQDRTDDREADWYRRQIQTNQP